MWTSCHDALRRDLVQDFHVLRRQDNESQTLFPGLDGFAKSIKLKMNWEAGSYDYLQFVRKSAAKNFKLMYCVSSND